MMETAFASIYIVRLTLDVEPFMESFTCAQNNYAYFHKYSVRTPYSTYRGYVELCCPLLAPATATGKQETNIGI